MAANAAGEEACYSQTVWQGIVEPRACRTFWFIMQPGGNVPSSTDLTVWLSVNSVGKLIISFTDQGSDLI